MRRFRFRFQRVLEVKGRMEEVRKAALGQAVGAFETERRELEHLRQLRGEQIRTPRPDGGQVVDLGMMRLLASYGARLEREESQQGEQVRVVSALVDDKRQELLAATRERRVFEILRERAAAAHQHRVRRHERAQLDEVGAQLHLRRLRAGSASEDWVQPEDGVTP